MPHHVKLEIFLTKYDKDLLKRAIDIHCVLSPIDGSDPNLFMMEVLPKNALNEATTRFSHVADPVDLQDYPIGMDINKAYFRTNDVTLRVRSEFQVKSIVEKFKDGLSRLIMALDYLDEQIQESEPFFSQTF